METNEAVSAAEQDRAIGPAGQPAGKAQALVLLSINTMPILASASLVPSLPIFMKHFSAVTGSRYLVPMIITLPTLCIGLFSTLAGVVSDRWGRRRLILAALVLFTVCGVAPLLWADLSSIFAARFGLGIGEAVMLTAGNTLMGDYFGGEVRRRWLSYSMVLGAIVGALVLLSGGFLAGLWWRAPFALYGVGAVLFATAAIFLWEPPRRNPKASEMSNGARASRFPLQRALVVAAVTFLAGVPYFAQNTQHGRIFAGLGLKTPFEISLFATLSGLGTITGSIAFRKLSVLTIERLLAVILLIFAFSFIGLSMHPPLWAGTGLDIFSQIACGLSYPTLLAWALNSFAPEHRGRGVGVWSATFFASSFISGLLVGFIDQFTPDFLHTMGVLGWGCAAGALLVLIRPRILAVPVPSSATST